MVPCACEYIEPFTSKVWSCINTALVFWYILELLFNSYMERLKREGRPN